MKTEQPNLTVTQLAKPLRTGDIPNLMKAIATGFGEFLPKAVQPLVQRVIELEKVAVKQNERIAELEARPVMKYAGIWNHGKVYGAGNFVTDSGSVFHAQRASVGERPGSGSDAWVLAVKKGKDAK